MYTTSHILEHHGVKGQKWGVRRYSKSSSRSKEKIARKASRQREKSWTKSYESRSKLSDQELRAKVNRLQLENQFRQQVQIAEQSSHTLGKQLVQQNASQAISQFGSAMIKKSLKAAALV